MPLEQIVEDNWPLGWIPSSSVQADFGAASQGLLRMDNLTLDEKGSLRLINRPTLQINALLSHAINSIYATYVNGQKLRYAYESNGTLVRNFGSAVSLIIYDLILGTTGSSQKAGFINALGHVLIFAGNLQIKDRGDIQWPLTIPTPSLAPVLTNLLANTVDLDNLDGSLHYTNWVSISSGSFTNSGTEIDFTPLVVTAVIASFQTTYSGAGVDTTNFGAPGEDQPTDPFVFTFSIVDATKIIGLQIEFFCQDPAGTVTDYFIGGIDYTINPPPPSGVLTNIILLRQQFTRFGSTSNIGWNTVKASRVTISYSASTTCVFKNFYVGSGVVLGQQEYIRVEINNTGQFLQFSSASPQSTIEASVNNIQVDPSNAAANSQANEVRIYRNNQVLGQFLEVNRQTGAYGFTPSLFVDNLSDQDAIADTALDPSRVLQFFRTNLPTTIIGAIFFASRVIFLTDTSFLPSFQLDFGTYDSRFEYQLTGTNSEKCLFIAKLSVNTFIVATTVDFYQVSGTFSLISTTNPDGTTTTIQDVTIVPLGISDPAISREFAEVEGNLFYMSARGLRSMVNGVSTLLNTTMDLLFRNEARYGFPAVQLGSNDTSQIGIVSSGTRIYIAVPFTNGSNSILVSTYNPPNAADLRGSNYWRPIVLNAYCMCREQDGTVLYGDGVGSVQSLEDNFNPALKLTIDMLTQYNFGQNPTSTKTLGNFLIFINTGGIDIQLVIYGLLEDATIVTFTHTLNTSTPTLVAVDPSATLTNCVAFAYNLTGLAAILEVNYSVYIVIEEYPPLTYYAITPFNNFGTNEVKQLSKWSYVIDPLGHLTTVKVTCDGVVLSIQEIVPEVGENIITASWYNFDNIIGTDWQIEVFAPQGMHFYRFLEPTILQKYPTLTYYALVPFSNLGKDTLKKLAKWGFVVDTFGHSILARVTADNVIITTTFDQSAEPQGISTEFWYNNEDVAALDWQLEIIAPQGMRFYKFMAPDILQVYPPGRLLDQVGPLDLDKQGIVYGFRIRLINAGATFHYSVLDNDVEVYSNDVATATNEDVTYIEKFPKGVNTSVCRLLITAATLMYRFSLELLVRTTGNETDNTWIKIQNVK